ncbi:MAG: hypothetical protein E7231_15140 [Cellulosilyticum sp.]|nr:hypothetical protein [Cellulosilyticum sp.]
MRKKISYLLSLVMFISMCSVNPTYIKAAEKISLVYLSQIGLKETEEGLKQTEISKDTEEATVQWNIDGGDGKYQLEYYTDTINDNPNDTTKVVLEFDVGKDKSGVADPKKVKVTAELFKSDGTTKVDLTSYGYKFPYQGEYTDITTGSTYTTELKIPVATEAVATADKELSLQLGSNLKVRMVTDGKIMTVWTNQVNRGYITDFTLKYKNAVQDTIIVFPGLKEVEVSSIHLEAGDGLNDRTTPIDTSKGEVAGSKPGFKVEIEKPLIRNGNKYEVINNTQAAQVKVALKLGTRLEPDDTVSANQIQLNFDLEGANKLQGEIVKDKNKYAHVDTTNNKISIYIAKSTDEVDADVKDQVVEWPALEESMVIGGELTLNGQVQTTVGSGTDTLTKTHSISTANIALNTGYTYLMFTPEQSNVGEVTLQITPYKYKGEITYKVYVANATSSTTPGAITENSLLGEYRFTYNPTYPDRKLEISIPSGVESIFLVKADLTHDASDGTSQEVYFNAQSGSTIVRPYTPYIREVNKIYVIPKIDPETGKEIQSKVEAAGMNVIWSAPTEDKLIETLKSTDAQPQPKKLYFELSLHKDDKADKAIIAVFEATYNTTTRQVEVVQVGNSKATVTYDRDKNQFIAENVVLKDLQKSYWEKIQFPIDYEKGTTYPNVEDYYAEDMVYEIPHSFYLSMRTVLEAGTKDSTTILKTSANDSSLYPITLDKTSNVLPSPTDVRVKKYQETTKVTVGFDDVSVQSFVDYTLTPAQWFLVGSDKNKTFPGKYEIAIYQANYIGEGNETKENDISDSLLVSYIESGNDKIYNWTPNLTTTPAALDISTNQNALAALRQGKVVTFTLEKDHIGGATNEIDVSGLDPNQSYYVRIRVKLESQQRASDGQIRKPDYSLFSKIVGFTTSTIVKPIEPDEEVPPTPKDYTATAKDNSTAILNWKDPDITIGATDSVSYEIIRTTEKELSETLLKRNIKAADIISQETAKNATLFGSEHYKLISATDTTDATYELTDATLQPNTVYYYYIRTVYNGVYSDWIHQPVTTMNIEKPISLKAFNATKTTVDISFLAKVPKSALYNTYDFGIAIQGEDGQWNTTLASSLSTVSGDTTTTTNEEGYNYYAYQITGLTPGKRYNIKVCVIDKTKDQIDGKYQQSLYSNIVYVRTEYDQDQQNKEDKFEEYLKRFDQEIEKFKNNPYWMVEDGSTYKYKEDYLAAEMGVSKEYTLVSDTNSNRAKYYLPISVLSKINEGKITLKIELGDEEVYIRPNTIRNDHELLQEANDLVQANRLEDYYLGITVDKNKYSGTINGEEVVSPKVSVNMDFVYMKQEDILTEADILEALEEILSSKREKFITKLENKLSTGRLDEDVLQEILDDVLADVEQEHMKKVDRIMDKQIKKEVGINEVSNAILIIHNGDHAAVNGYYYLSNWTQVEVLTVGDGFAIEAKTLGTYIFTGQKPLIDTVPEVAPYQSFINQYQLTEFFTMDSYQLQVAVSKKQLYGALARMLGASKGSDYITYLESKGIKGISKLTSNNAIRQDEAIYIAMQGYELLKHRKINTISIKNKQSVLNIGAFQPIYREYVYAAVELKIVQPQDSRVLPSKQMTATEVIKMLYKIQG